MPSFQLAFTLDCGMGRAMQMPSRFLSPEWAHQTALWVGWPHLHAEWGPAFEGARAEIAGFIHAARGFVPVRVACGSDAALESAANALDLSGPSIRLEAVPTGDIWLRDTGPVFAKVDGQPGALCFQFNGWGGKFIMQGDAETAQAIATREGLAAHAHPFILEGGAIECDGEGRLITTRQCLLNPNRNRDWRAPDAERALKSAFGVNQIIWLERGLAGDHTDGHVDNIARFVGAGHVVCQRASGPDDPNAEVFAEIERALLDAGLKVTVLPSPGRVTGPDGDILAGSHMNFVVLNGAVILPAYEPDYSRQAAAILADVFPTREIIPLPSGQILRGGGSFHCMTREVPQFTEGGRR